VQVAGTWQVWVHGAPAANGQLKLQPVVHVPVTWAPLSTSIVQPLPVHAYVHTEPLSHVMLHAAVHEKLQVAPLSHTRRQPGRSQYAVMSETYVQSPVVQRTPGPSTIGPSISAPSPSGPSPLPPSPPPPEPAPARSNPIRPHPIAPIITTAAS
jgi:hypothetical protein